MKVVTRTIRKWANELQEKIMFKDGTEKKRCIVPPFFVPFNILASKSICRKTLRWKLKRCANERMTKYCFCQVGHCRHLKSLVFLEIFLLDCYLILRSARSFQSIMGISTRLGKRNRTMRT